MPLKYRIWSVDHKLLLEVYALLQYPDGRVSFKAEVVVNGKHTLVDGKRLDVHGYLGEKFILMKSTDKFDKNGKEIFEGDIVNRKACPHHVLRFDEVTEVVVERNSAFVLETKLKTGSAYIGFDHPFTRSELLEVVGNVHENPDLVA